MRFVSEAEMRSLLASIEDLWPSVVGAFRDGYAATEQGATHAPRFHVDFPPGSGIDHCLRLLPAIVPALGLASLRFYTGNYPAWRSETLVLYRYEDMRPLAMLADVALHDIRTAAPSALAATLLARPGAERLAIIGSGRHGRAHLQAMQAVLPIAEACVWSPNPAHREDFVRTMSAIVPCPLRSAASAEDAVRQADVIVLATNAYAPVLDGAWVKPGAFVVSLARKELDDTTVLRSNRIVVALRELIFNDSPTREPFSTLLRNGRLQRAALETELADVLSGRAPGRERDDDICLFASTGNPLWDTFVGRWALAAAESRGAGRTVAFWEEPGT